VTRSPVSPDAALLTDRVAVVTGAAQGIGRATALALARFGAHLALCDRKAEGLAATAAEVERLGRQVVTAEIDVRDPEGVTTFLEQVEAQYGHVDVLVNNAGGGFWSPFLDVTPKGQDALVRENFTSVTLLIRGCVPLMGERGGSIVNVTSVEAHRAGPGFAVYSAMKAAVENLTKSLALELNERRIRVNSVAPDMIPTPGDEGLADASAAMSERSWSAQPWPEEATADDCAAVITFLAGDLARFVTGTTVHVDGGTHAAGGWKQKPDQTWVL
jgi:NAD(P)-dependent dehydrogenase (short-subunit alcohol dehydrogenase family)